MPNYRQKTAGDWVSTAETFLARGDHIGALSSARNALRLDAKHLAAWRIASDTAWKQERHFVAGRYARAWKRFALRANDTAAVDGADRRLAAVAEYFASRHRLLGETDLTHAAARGDLHVVRQLVASGADVNELNRTGWTPLHVVGARGTPEMTRLLVELGANLEAQDALGETPLVTACRFGNPNVVPVLLECGANVGHVSKEKFTALWYAISSQKDPTLVQMLLEAGADPNETYEYGDNPFLVAVSAQAPAVVDLLLPLTEDLARMNMHQVCALHFAAGYDDVGLVQDLLQRGVDVNCKTLYGRTALMNAAERNSLKAARVLLAHGADGKAQSEYGDTALSLAERREHAEMIELLRS